MSDQKENIKSWLDYLYLFLKWRRFIVINFLFVVLVTYGITLLLPKWYHSESVVLPPRDKGMGPLMGMGNIARMVGLGGPAGILGGQELFSYMSILKSRSVQETIIHEFDLFEVYKIDDRLMEDALKELRSNVKFEIDEEGALVIGVYDRDPERAAAMANRFVDLLHKHNTELSVSEARARRQFIERRLDQNKIELTELEEKVKSFQSDYGVIILPEQSEQSVRAIAEIYAARTMKEIERDIAREVVGRDNPMFRKAQLELNALNRKLEGVPDQTIESIRIARDLLIQQKIFELLMPLLEEARLEELRDTPTVLVLDRAVPAEEKSRPKRLLITLAMGIVSLMFSIGYVVSSDRVESIKVSDPEKYKTIEEIGRIIRNPFKRT